MPSSREVVAGLMSGLALELSGLCSVELGLDCALWVWTVLCGAGLCSLELAGLCSVGLDCALWSWLDWALCVWTVLSGSGLCSVCLDCALWSWTVLCGAGWTVLCGAGWTVTVPGRIREVRQPGCPVRGDRLWQATRQQRGVGSQRSRGDNAYHINDTPSQ